MDTAGVPSVVAGDLVELDALTIEVDPAEVGFVELGTVVVDADTHCWSPMGSAQERVPFSNKSSHVTSWYTTFDCQ